MAGRQVAAHVPEFLEIVVVGALGGLDPERDVAARAAFHARVLLLGFDGQGEEGLGGVYGGVDAGLIQVIVRQDRETVAFERRAQLLGEAREVLRVKREGNRSDSGVGHVDEPWVCKLLNE